MIWNRPNMTEQILTGTQSLNTNKQAVWVQIRAIPGSEFVVANTLGKWKKLEPNEFDFSQWFSQKGISLYGRFLKTDELIKAILESPKAH